VENAIFSVVVISEKSSKLSAVSMHHCQVQRTEVFVEGEISQVVIDVEEKGVLKILRWLCVTNPVKFI
jgi:hypothetical protein